LYWHWLIRMCGPNNFKAMVVNEFTIMHPGPLRVERS
jgi:hypothetical protein